MGEVIVSDEPTNEPDNDHRRHLTTIRHGNRLRHGSLPQPKDSYQETDRNASQVHCAVRPARVGAGDVDFSSSKAVNTPFQ